MSDELYVVVEGCVPSYFEDAFGQKPTQNVVYGPAIKTYCEQFAKNAQLTANYGKGPMENYAYFRVKKVNYNV